MSDKKLKELFAEGPMGKGKAKLLTPGLPKVKQFVVGDCVVEFNARGNGCTFAFPDGTVVECYINSHTPDKVTVTQLAGTHRLLVYPASSNSIEIK